MRSQGWEPGQYLGAHDAAHAESYTAANASYIRVTLKDDMKGLGFHKAKEDQVTGLDIFSDLLSRLNGKSEEEIEDGQQARMAVKANLYVEQKWGPMRFVKGGLLVGDKLESLEDAQSTKENSSSDEASQEEKPKKSKKRKASEEAEDDEQEESEAARKKRRKEERKLKKAMEKPTDEADAPEGDETKSKKKSKKSKKSKSEDGSDEATPAEETKAERKERKREKKEKKRKRKEAQESDGDATTSATASAVPSGVSTPNATGTSTPVRGSRNFVRSRFIAQKKEALLDAKALNQVGFPRRRLLDWLTDKPQIFMVKA
jgi:Pin2-interacting protein X1